MKRRRFLTITAGLAGASALPGAAFAAASPAAEPLSIWRGTAIGSAATIAIAAPDAQAHLDAARAEIARLEQVFSLFDAQSQLSRLNRDGALDAPALELVECLSLAGQIHRVTDGLFDPSVQPLWAAWARAAAEGRQPTDAELTAARNVTGWQGVTVGTDRIALPQGAALTLNGIAQGYIADRVAALMTARGLGDVFIDSGEFRAMGRRAPDREWEATLPGGATATLRDRAMATSSPMGTSFDGKAGHILDPRTGQPAGAVWGSVTVTAGLAAIADGLSTAACLMPDRASIEAACAQLPDASLTQALAA